MDNHQNFSKSDLNSIVESYHSNHKRNRPECTIQTPSDDGLQKIKPSNACQNKTSVQAVDYHSAPEVLIVDDDAASDLKALTTNESEASLVKQANPAPAVQTTNHVNAPNDATTKKVEEAKKVEEPVSTPTTTPVVDAKTDNPDHKVIEMKAEDVNAKASTFIDHDNDNKNVSPAHKQNDGKAKNKNTPTFVPDANGIIHTTVQAVSDLSAESIYGHDRKIYITAKFAKKMGLGAPNVKALDVDGIMIPIERLTKQELRHIKHEEAEQTRKTRREKRIARRNGDDDLI